MGKPTNTEHRETLHGADIAQAIRVIDDSTAKEIQQNLQESRQWGYVPVTSEEKAHHRALNRKLGLLLLSFCAVIYIFNGLDRSNLRNAETNGFTADLGIPASTVNTASSLFFATYVPLAPLSTSIGKRVGQTTWLGIISVGWGALTLGHAFIKTETQLIVLRLFIGLFDAACTRR
jgi:hypothetical protein